MTNEALMGGYLRRLGLEARPTPSRAALEELVFAHMHAVPFENLDIVDGVQRDLTTAGCLEKIVARRRGGICYELNEAFGALLVHLGFTVRRIEARVWLELQQRFGPPYDHLALIVDLPEGDFLADVGFGDNNRTPMRFPEDVLEDISGRYRLEQVSDVIWFLSRADRPIYEMTLEARPLSAFVPMYRHHQTSPDSVFARGILCTRATVGGRVTLSRDRLILVNGASRTESYRLDCDDVLEQYFDIAKGDVPC